ncbi:DNA helicase RecG [Candidatus Peregrinibacteria bacterium HGW-Peregrinibacteria-1]|jgi:ATP-dependent DNA helicase RecG|nr:MAG: DNA helicase RecG [Candidatus Peregrinibacteria bacterium HGW-Peregrinibacteria-1]
MLNLRVSRAIRTTRPYLDRLERLGVTTVKDFVSYFPRTYNDLTGYKPIIDLVAGENATICGKLSNLVVIRTRNGMKMLKGVVTDATASVEVVWFNQTHLLKILPRNKELVLTGRVGFSFGKLSLQSPLYEIGDSGGEVIHGGRIVPVYHEVAGISSKWLRSKIKLLLDEYKSLFKEYLPEEILKAENLMGYGDALTQIHFPESDEALGEARRRLAFDEIFLMQVKILQKKALFQVGNAKPEMVMSRKEDIINGCIADLDFELTGAQVRVLDEVLVDMGRGYPMSRLIQGDVGSGKTIVAALAALNVVKNGFQVAIMAPTEILAKQHFISFMKVMRPFGFNIQFIAGSTKASQKDDILRQMKNGLVDIVIGTHALIQEKIGFKKLGLAVVDEQHRFGVKQRDILRNFGVPHFLNMTATPIPRTLAITMYGDQDISVIDEMPKGRQEVITRLVPEKKRLDAYRWVEEQTKMGRQAFIICPLIEDSENLEGVKSVVQEYEYLSKNIFPNLRLVFLHGKLKQDEKDQIMEDFKAKKFDILVSTSVIEVGIDVPNATMMLIEGAERFGLAQLHQFRGRVGRGSNQSYCFLFTGKTGKDGLSRLKAMEKYSSGFKLSEIDLELRGPGEVYGVRQSGVPDLKVADLRDLGLIEKANIWAQKIIKMDATLASFGKLAVKLNGGGGVYTED